MTKVELKSFKFFGGHKSLCIDNAFLGRLQKRMLFTMIKKTDFLGCFDTNPYYFRHLDANYFTLYYNGNPIPIECLRMDMSHCKTSVIAYITLI